MIAVKETTVFADDKTYPHTYCLEGDKMFAYIKHGTTEVVKFKNPITLNMRHRKFVELKNNPFDIQVESSLIKVEGSKGSVYYVDPDKKTCTCSGFRFRSSCKHLGVLK